MSREQDRETLERAAELVADIAAARDKAKSKHLKATWKIEELETQLAAAEEKEIATWQTNQAQGRHIDTLHAELGAEREKVRVLREALDAIAESEWDASTGLLRDIANEAIATTEPEDGE